MIFLWRTKLSLLILTSSIVSLSEAENVSNNITEKALSKKRVLPIFNVVNFQNLVCRSMTTFTSGTSNARNGTCFTQSECDAKGGVKSGNCASGFGVCCIFIFTTSGSIINQNNTYIQNPGFPTALTSTGAISYTINKCSGNICWIRLDFETFNIIGPTDTVETLGGNCAADSFKITTNTNTNLQQIPTICGTNSGQHVYIDVGTLNADNAILMFAFTGTNTGRNWDIRVSQIECTNPNRPPFGCLQYQTTLTGRIQTFNFLPTSGVNIQHLAGQEYSACIRRESGFCCIQYQVCADPALITAMTAFTLDGSQGAGAGAAKALQDSSCINDYVGIPASNTECSANSNSLFSKYCGQRFSSSSMSTINSPVCDCTPPFFVHVHTDLVATANEANTVNRGVCLDYTQIPCTTN